MTAKNHTVSVSIAFLASVITKKIALNRNDIYFKIPFLFSHYFMYSLLARFRDE